MEQKLQQKCCNHLTAKASVSSSPLKKVIPYKSKQSQLERLRNAQLYSLYHNKDLEKNNESQEYS